MIRLIFPTIVFAAASGISFIVTYFKDIHNQKRTYGIFWQHYSICLFAIYIMPLISVTLINRRINVEQGCNLIPFSNFAYAFRYQRTHLITMIILNIIMLIPYGFLMPFALRRFKTIFQILSGIVLVILVEIAQLITGRGTYDADDIIFCSLGILIGFGLYKLLMKLVSKLKNKSGETL